MLDADEKSMRYLRMAFNEVTGKRSIAPELLGDLSELLSSIRESERTFAARNPGAVAGSRDRQQRFQRMASRRGPAHPRPPASISTASMTLFLTSGPS